MFILQESTMNGTVTMDTFVFGINKNTFTEAKNYVKTKVNYAFHNVTIIEDTEFILRYNAHPIRYNAHPIYGILKNEPLTML